MADEQILVSGIYGSRYLSAADIADSEYIGVIYEVGVDLLKDSDDVIRHRIVIQISDCPKRIALNSTNASNLCDAWGDNALDWVEHRVRVSTQRVRFQGRFVPGLLIEPVESE